MKPPANWPNISDYWPDTPVVRRRRRPALLTGLLALFVIGGSVVLARPLADAEIRQRASGPVIIPPESPQAVISLQPSPPAPRPLPTTPVRASPLRGRFEVVTGLTDLVVRTARLDDADFRVSGPAEGAFTGGVLRVSARPGDAGPVEVLLSDRRIWQLRTGAGTRSVALDLSAGAVNRIDLNGGAERIDMTLGRLSGTVPIRMAGGVSIWRIVTAVQVPVRVQVASGAGDVALYGQHSDGTAAGTTVRSGDLDAAPGLDIVAAGGLGTLEVTRS
ncbi:hypothetical protein [Actinoplanes siamensis]|uniref:Uncharacterized protein n=1 Tax=Actinoplanes siamensis TaxID=1223317 RepID=A0A919TJ41_9ACTN|nr:hypothetical protein [Actinoplanes siamensis]GIF04896.1 hypothetical protein Asi03nite_24340 [Actinoplanes siamensis]